MVSFLSLFLKSTQYSPDGFNNYDRYNHRMRYCWIGSNNLDSNDWQPNNVKWRRAWCGARQQDVHLINHEVNSVDEVEQCRASNDGDPGQQ